MIIWRTRRKLPRAKDDATCVVQTMKKVHMALTFTWIDAYAARNAARAPNADGGPNCVG